MVVFGRAFFSFELSKVEHEAMDCKLGEWRDMGTVEEGMSLITRDL